MGGVGSVGVVVKAPVFDDHSGLEEAVEAPRVEQFVAELAVEALDPGVCQGDPGSMNIASVPLNRHQSSTA